jgi:hypothetical protein
MTAYVTDLLEGLRGNHNYASPHFNVASYKMNPRSDCLAISMNSNKDTKSGCTARPGSDGNPLSCSHPRNALPGYTTTHWRYF